MAGAGSGDQAEEFRALHRAPPLLVLPNAWDVASAKAFAALPGCRALATSSAAVARSLGWEDGEQAPVSEMLQVVERIAAAVEVPVTADLEAGYGDPPGTAAAALAAGAAGMNLEDSHGESELMPLDEQVSPDPRGSCRGARARAERTSRCLRHGHRRGGRGRGSRQRLPRGGCGLRLSDPRTDGVDRRSHRRDLRAREHPCGSSRPADRRAGTPRALRASRSARDSPRLRSPRPRASRRSRRRQSVSVAPSSSSSCRLTSRPPP